MKTSALSECIYSKSLTYPTTSRRLKIPAIFLFVNIFVLLVVAFMWWEEYNYSNLVGYFNLLFLRDPYRCRALEGHISDSTPDSICFKENCLPTLDIDGSVVSSPNDTSQQHCWCSELCVTNYPTACSVIQGIFLPHSLLTQFNPPENKDFTESMTTTTSAKMLQQGGLRYSSDFTGPLVSSCKVHGCETRSGYKAWRRQCAESNELCTENCLCHVHCDNKAEQKLWHDSSRSVDENCLHRLPFLLHKKTEVCLIGPCYHTHSEKYFKQTTGLMLQPSFYMDQTCTCRSECMRHSDAICLQKMEGAVRGTGKKASVSINCQYHQQSDSCHCQWHRLTHQSAALVNRTCALLYTLFGLSCQNSLPLVPS